MSEHFSPIICAIAQVLPDGMLGMIDALVESTLNEVGLQDRLIAMIGRGDPNVSAAFWP